MRRLIRALPIINEQIADAERRQVRHVAWFLAGLAVFAAALVVSLFYIGAWGPWALCFAFSLTGGVTMGLAKRRLTHEDVLLETLRVERSFHYGRR